MIGLGKGAKRSEADYLAFRDGVLNARLADAVRGAGVIEPQDFATFQDHGYMGLHGGL